MREGRLPVGGALVGGGLGLVGWLGYALLSRSPNLAESIVGMGPIPEIRRGISVLTGWIPLPLAELFVGVVMLALATAALGGVSRGWKGEEAPTRVLLRGGLRVFRDGGVLLFLFYLLWGLQYARPGFETRLGIEGSGEVSSAELREYAIRSVEISNALYREIHGSPDAGVPTPAPSLDEVMAGLEEGWLRVQDRFDLSGQVGRRHGAPKAFLASPIMKRLGVAGMYFPYTGEALVLRDLPGILVGKDLGHEMAHQRGFASESDANVLGFLVARESPDPVVRYSAYSFLQRQLVSALQRLSAAEARDVARLRDPGVVRDVQDLNEYWQPARGAAGVAATRVNDRMLRSHGIPEGVASYQGSVWVLIALARSHGEDAIF